MESQTHPFRLAVGIVEGAALILALLTPVTASASALPSIAADDTVAGLGTVIAVSGVAPGKTQVLLRTPSTDVPLPLTVDASGEGTVRVAGELTKEAGTYRTSLPDGAAKALFTVLPDRVSAEASRVSVDRASVAPDGADEAVVTVAILDRYGNPLPGRPVTLVSSRASDRVSGMAAETDEAGEIRFRFRAAERGRAVLRAVDAFSGLPLESTAMVSVGDTDGIGGDDDPPPSPYGAQLVRRAAAQDAFGVIDHFEVTVDPPTMQVGMVANTLTVRAVDRNSRTVENYRGTLRVTSPTDPDATLPGIGAKPGEGRIVMTDRHLGVLSSYLSLAFSRSGEQAVLVEDRTDPSRPIEGRVIVQVTGTDRIPAGEKIHITTPQPSGKVNTRVIRVEGDAKPLANLKLLGPTRDYGSESDGTGHFVFGAVELPDDQRQFTLRVLEIDGRGDSGPIPIEFDGDAPEVKRVTFVPPNPRVEGNFLVVVETNEKGAQALIALGDQTVALQENSSAAGTYQGFLTARKAGEFQPTVRVVDGAGNKTDVKIPLTIVEKAPPVVSGLRASPRASAVELAWDPAESAEKIEKYRIYVGEDPKDLSMVETKDATAAAVIQGLRAGVEYHFAVTAVIGSRESEEKSAFVSARPIGLKLDASAKEEAAELTWAFPDAPELSAYLLEYGVDEGTYPEKRILNGRIETATVRDLLPGVVYYFRLTPLAINGQPMSELAATGEAQPLAMEGGFHASPSEEVPIDPDAIPPSDRYHEGAPSTPGSGVPAAAWYGMGALALVGGLVRWRMQRAKRLTAEFLRVMERQYKQL